MTYLPKNKNEEEKGTNSIMRYAGFATNMLVLLILSIVGGKYIDAYFQFSYPAFVAGLPFLVIVYLLYKIIKDTARK